MAKDDGPKKSSVCNFRLTPSVAEKRIRELARNSENIIWSDHALERMEERGIIDGQVLDVLRTGMVCDQPELTEYDEWKCKTTKEIRGRRKVGVVSILLHNDRLLVATVEWEDTS